MDIVLSYPNQVFISLFLAFVFGVIATFKPNFAFYAVCLFLPAYILRIRGTVIPTNMLELLIVMTVMGWLGYSLGHRKTHQNSQGTAIYLPDKRFLVGVGLIIIGAFISLAISKNEFFLQGSGIFKGFIIEPIIFSIALYSAVRQKLVNKERIIQMLVWSASVVAIISLFGGFIPALEFWTYDNRLRGFYLSPNHLAMYLAPIIPLAIAQAVSRFASARDLSIRISRSGKGFLALMTLIGLPLAGILLLLIVLFLTKSFGAWLALAAAAITALFIWRKSFNPKVILPGGLILSLIFGFIFREELAGFLLNPERSSWASRFQIWSAALAILKDNPLLGIGLGTFQEYYLAYQKYFSPYLEWAVPQPHNLILAFWLQTGMIGLIGFLWLVINFFARFYKIVKTIPHQSLQHGAGRAAIVCAVVMVLVQGSVDTTIWKNDLATLFFILINLF